MSSRSRSSLDSKSTRSHQSEMERSLVRAATRKAEQQCRAEALKKKHELEEQEFRLQRRKEQLEVETELQVEEAKLAALDRISETQSERSSCKSKPLFDSTHPDMHHIIKQWVETGSYKPEPSVISCPDYDHTNLQDADQGFTTSIHNSEQKSEYITSREPKETSCQPTSGWESQFPSLSKRYVPLPPREGANNSCNPHNEEKVMPSSRKQHDLSSQTCQSLKPKKEPGYIFNQKSSSSTAGRITGNGNPWSGENSPSGTAIGQTGEIIKTLANMLLEQQKIATLPKIEVEKYDGNPLQYNAWKQSFKFTVEDKTSNEMDRLFFLEKSTIGEPNKVVKGMLNRGPTGYTEAMEQIERKFGNRYKIAEAFKVKAEQWPDVKRDDGTAWSGFSIFLGQYWNTMQDLQFTSEVDHSSMIRRLLEKLPYAIVNQWRVLVDKLESQEERIAGFEEFVNFIEKQARIVNNPLYGSVSTNSKNLSSKKNQPMHKKRSSFAAKTEEKGPGTTHKGKWCEFCENDTHMLSTCTDLRKKPHGERISFMKGKSLCYGCLKKSTHLCKDCKSKLTCKICSKKHPTVLHNENRGDNKGKEGNGSTGAGNVTENTVHQNINSGLAGASNCTLLPVIVRNRVTGECAKTIAMLDEGSDAVFCSQKLSNQLGTSGPKAKLRVHTITGDKFVNSCKIQQLEVMDVDCENVIPLPTVYTCPTIPANPASYPNQEDLTPWPYLHDVKLPKIKGSVEILIGNNVPKALEPWEIINSRGEGPYACKTPLGWTVHGLKSTHETDGLACSRITVEDVHQQLIEMYNQDYTELVVDDKPERSMEDHKFMSIVEDTVKLKDGHYEIGLPLRNRDMVFPDNKCMAERRIQHLRRKFVRKPSFKEEYTKAMNDALEKGYAEPVPESKTVSTPGNTWFIPHHGVSHPRKKKLRVVFDCAASYKGVSLNEELLQGPDLTNSLLGVILKFRQEPIAFMGDIEAMFNQVVVPEQDRDLLSFLWWPEGDVNKPVREYRMTTHLFGATSSPSCSNFALKKTALDNKDTTGRDVMETINDNFYVDDCLKSVASEEEAVTLIKDLSSTLQKGGFKITKWISNSRRVVESVPEERRAKSLKSLKFLDSLPQERALGVLWSAESDMFSYNIELKQQPVTRRGILSTVASEPIDVYSTIISSQFDADRLDYLVRDRQMSGVAIGKFDLEWILDCLRIGDVYAGQRGEPDPIKVPGLVLDHKGFSAAEGYLEARYELYSTVYLHKTTRAAEQMLAALLRRTAEKLTENTLGKLGLSPRNPLFQFLKLDRPQLELYVRIDDAIVWSAIDDIAHCKDSELCELAQRIKSRRLFKCVDIGALVTEPGSDLVYRFRDALFEAAPTLGIERDWTLLEDQPRVVGYDWYSWGDENALKKVLVMNPEHNTNIDIGQKSDIIQTLSKKEFHRFYVPNEETREAVKQIWRDTVR